MLVFRIRDYSTNYPPNRNNHKHKIEAVSEEKAWWADVEVNWIYFFADLTAPEGL